jgi:hypothetical protein
MLSDAHARLNLPYPMNPPPSLEPPPRTGGGPSGSLPISPTSRRRWIAGLTGGALGPLGDSLQERFRDPVLVLVHRITQGFSLAEYERARALGFDGYLEEQLDHLAIDDSAMEALLPRFPVLAMSPREVYFGFSDRVTLANRYLKNASVARATNSRRQLFERMVEFWTDHFNVDVNKGLGFALVPEYVTTAIRPHALGSFP